MKYTLHVDGSDSQEYVIENIIEKPLGDIEYAKKTNRFALLRIDDGDGEYTIHLNPEHIVFMRIEEQPC